MTSLLLGPQVALGRAPSTVVLARVAQAADPAPVLEHRAHVAGLALAVLALAGLEGLAHRGAIPEGLGVLNALRLGALPGSLLLVSTITQ